MANSVFQHKRTSISGRAANSTTLPNPGQIAINMADGIMYSTNGTFVFEIGANNTNVRVTGNATLNGVIANGSLGTAGQILMSNATSTYWASSANNATNLGGVASASYLRKDATATIGIGYNVTANGLGTISSGTTTLNPALGNYQFYTNGGAHIIAAPSSDCAIDVLVINGASSGAITLSGFKTPAAGQAGATYATTNSTWWVLSVRRVNAVATYFWQGPWT